jgi:hypothetical protein
MAADERAKGLEEVERAIEWPRDGGHERSLARLAADHETSTKCPWIGSIGTFE